MQEYNILRKRMYLVVIIQTQIFAPSKCVQFINQDAKTFTIA